MNRKGLTVKRISYDALLAAMCAVLGYVSLDLGVIKLTFENFPVLIGALLFGPADGMLVGGIGTFLYQLLRYGLDASTVLWILPYVLSGLFAGLFAKTLRRNGKLRRIILVVVADGLLVTGLNTLSLYITYQYLWFMPVETVIAKTPLRVGLGILKSVIFAVVLPLVLKVLRKVTMTEKAAGAEADRGPSEIQQEKSGTVGEEE